MSKAPQGEYTDLHKRFVEGLKKGLQPTEALRQAGSSDPDGDLDRVMANRVVQYYAFKALLKVNANMPVYWKGLIEDAKHILHAGMRAGDIDTAMKAACKVLDTAAKMDGKPLTDRAEAEDDATDRQSLADAVNAAAKEDVANCPIPMLPTNEREH